MSTIQMSTHGLGLSVLLLLVLITGGCAIHDAEPTFGTAAPLDRPRPAIETPATAPHDTERAPMRLYAADRLGYRLHEQMQPDQP